jgi:hypothetical protein
MTYYSKRQLEALGEPLGESVTRKEGGRIVYGGGGSSGGGGSAPAPTQTTAYNTNIPEYARPYVENMLQSAQRQVYNDDMTSFRPYTPYSSDVNNYFAGFSPLQQSAQQSAYYLKTPGQYDVASGLAGASGLGSIGVAGQAVGAGERFAMGATDPRTTQAYMSPYMQNVVDFQKSQALRDFGIGQPMRRAQAVGQGAFGGSRQAIAEAEAERGLMSQLQGIQATGTQKAFEDAQRQQQFGAQLGLQGYGTALQGLGQAGQAAGTLGQLGTQQFGAQKDIINLQSTLGREQQALEQNKINQAIQDYAIQQQYPMMQLGFLSNMIRGLPMQSQTTQLYQAQPSMLQQGIGLAGAAGTLFGKAEGGAIKMAEGGIVGYAPGGVIDSTRAKLEQIADMPGGVQKLEQLRSSSSSKEVREMATEILVEKQMQAQAEQQTQKNRMSGIALAGGPAFESQGMAGGGIIAFADEGLVDSGIDPETGEPYKKVNPVTRFSEYMNPFSGKGGFGYIARGGKSIEEYYNERSKAPPATEADRKAQAQMEVQDIEGSSAKDPTIRMANAPSTPGTTPTKPRAGPATVKGLEAYMTEQERLMGPNTVGQGLEAKIAERLAGMSKREKQDELAAMRQAFVRLGTEASPGGFLQAATKSIGTYGDASDAARKAREGMDLELTKMQADIKKGERAEKRGNLDAAAKAFESAENRQLRLAEMQNQLKAAGISASRPGELEKAFALFQKDPVAFEQFIAAKDTNRGNLAAATKNILQAKYPEYAMTAMIPPEKRTKQQNEYLQNAYKDAEATARDMMRKGSASTAGGPAGGGGNLVQNKDGSFNYVPR